jgi:hypothetical protein
MFALVLIALVLTAAAVAHLATVVVHDRPASPPRSHTHELDRHTARIH